MFTFKYMTYEEWIAENPNAKLDERVCPACDGTGEDECPCCGHEIDCEECGGEGVLNDAHTAYKEQLERDKKAVSKFMKSIGQDGRVVAKSLNKGE